MIGYTDWVSLLTESLILSAQCDAQEKRSKKKTYRFRIKRRCKGKTARILPRLTGKVIKYLNGFTTVSVKIEDVRKAEPYWKELLSVGETLSK